MKRCEIWKRRCKVVVLGQKNDQLQLNLNGFKWLLYHAIKHISHAVTLTAFNFIPCKHLSSLPSIYLLSNSRNVHQREMPIEGIDRGGWKVGGSNLKGVGFPHRRVDILLTESFETIFKFENACLKGVKNNIELQKDIFEINFQFL